MIIPVRTDSPLRSTPWVNWLLIASNIVVFLLQQSHLNDRHGNPPGMLDPGNLKLYAYFSYAFLHADAWHIAGNMLFLYIFGNNVNDKMGNFGYLAFYLAGGVFAGMMHVMTSNNPVLGASGAVAAVTGAYLVLLPRSNITIFYLFIFIGTFEIASMYFILFSFAWDLINSFARETNVAHYAHIGGTLFGSSICMALLGIKLLPRDQFDILALIGRWNRRRQYQDLVRSGYDPFGYIAPTETRRRPDPKMDKIHDLRAQIAEAVAHQKLQFAALLYIDLLGIDPNQVLSRTTQLDVANQLATDRRYPQAAAAYELFLKHYPNYDQIGQVELMLGIVYARYLHDPEKARQHLSIAAAKLVGRREYDLAQSELAALPNPS